MATNPPCWLCCNSPLLSRGQPHLMRVSVPNLKGLPEFGEASHGPDACLNCWSLHIWASCLASEEPRETAGALWVCMGQSCCKNWGSCGWLWSDCFHPDPGSPKRARASWTRQFWFISQPKRSQLVPLSSRANCPVCVCVCVLVSGGCVC